jgi:hypothetical protein
MNKHRFGGIWAVVLGLSMIFFLAGCSSSGDGVAGSSGGQTATTLATEVIGFTSSVELTSDDPEAVPKNYVPDCTIYDPLGILTRTGKINPQTASHTDGTLNLYLNVRPGWFLDWENTTPTTTSVLSVVVNSPQGGYLYNYDGSVVADTGLHAAAAGESGNFHMISYAAFCYLRTNGNGGNGNGEEYEGCSLGYWGATRGGGSNAGQVVHGDSWGPTGYEFTDPLDSVFTGAPKGDDSLLTALRYKGGPTLDDKKNLLLKQAVAGLLNAAHPDVDYPLTEEQLIALVNARLEEMEEDMNDILSLQMTLDAYNNLGCPLD